MNIIEENKLRVLAADLSAAEPLPGPLRQAFGEDSIAVGTYEVRKAVHADWIILEQWDSPIYREFLEQAKPEGATRDTVNWTLAEQMCLVYQFTHDVRSVRKLLKSGKDALVDAAMEMAETMDSPLAMKLFVAANQQMARNFNTAVKHAAEKDGGDPFPAAEPAAAKTG